MKMKIKQLRNVDKFWRWWFGVIEAPREARTERMDGLK